MFRRLAGLLLLCLAAPAAGGEAGLPRGRGVLLPLQDRVGDPFLVELTESLLREELEVHGELVELERVRQELRALRIRDASLEPPERLIALAESLEADWYFLATLHEARRGRRSQREESGEARELRLEDSGDVPQVVLSARLFLPESGELWWAGFDAGSGRDGEGVFGVGGVETLDELVTVGVRNLVRQAVEPGASRGRGRLRHRENGYLRASKRPSPPARVAVIPMDSVAEAASGASAEVATAALFAALDEIGFRTLLPGLVRSIRQESGDLRPGAVSRPEWEALARVGDADWIATGTVETYRRDSGSNPDPWVALAVRLLEAGDGRIAWLDGVERTGRETAAAFDRGRIYSSGDLTYAMMRSLFSAMLGAPRVARAELGD